MPQGIIIICLLLMVVAALASAMFHSMLKAAISLAAVSALLAIILFSMGATWAAIFELSVCSGLVTVVFISAISLTATDRHSQAKEAAHRKHFSALPFLLIAVGVGMISILLLTDFQVISTADPSAIQMGFKDTLWYLRQADVLGQIFIILAGAFAVVILFKEGDKE